MDLKEYRKLQADSFYDNLREATAPPFFYWQDPDTPLPQIGGEPRGISGHCFEADNALQLAMAAKAQGFQSPYWMGFDQAKEAGGHVRKGELGTKMLQWYRKDGELKSKIPVTVYNGDQIKGIDWPRPAGLTPEQQAARQAGLDALLPPRKKAPTLQQYNDRLKELLAEKFPANEDPRENARMTLCREYAAMTAQARLGLPRQVDPSLAQDLKPFIERRPHPMDLVRAMEEAYRVVGEIGIQALVYDQIPRKEMERKVKPAKEPSPKRERSKAPAKGKDMENEIPF